MFGIKIISEKQYQSEHKTALELYKFNETLVRKNASLEADIKSLREQNSKLRAENNDLSERIRKRNITIRGQKNTINAIKLALPGVEFNGYTPIPCKCKCSECSIEQEGCKKYTGLSLCMQPKDPSFRDNQQS